MEDNNIVSNERKNSCAIKTMRTMLLKLSDKTHKPFETLLLEFSKSPIYETLFDFDTENLIKSLIIEKGKGKNIYSFCLWNEKYILVGCNNSIKLFNIDEGKIIKEFNGLFHCVLSIFKFNHHIFGDCIVANDYSGASDNQGTISLLSIC